MSRLLISVVLPVYNNAAYLKQAVESILAQTYTNFELLIINDGSADESEKIILSFNDIRVKYIKNEVNLGLAATLNKAIRLAKGEYIARMDADDISMPDRFEKQLNHLISNPGIAIVGSVVDVIDSHGNITGRWNYPTNPEEVEVQIYRSCCFAHPSVMYRKDKILEAGLYNPQYAPNDDYELWIRLLKNNKGSNLPETLLKYRIHETQISAKNLYMQTLVCILIKNEIVLNPHKDYYDQAIENDIPEHLLDEELLKAFAFWINVHLDMHNIRQAIALRTELEAVIKKKDRRFKKVLISIDAKTALRSKKYLTAIFLLVQRALLF